VGGAETIVQALVEPDGAVRERLRRQGHLSILLLAVLVIAASFVLQVAPDGDRVYLHGAPAATLPPLCFMKALGGVPCPGCGLTRSFIYLAHGNPSASWQAHRLGWLLAALALVQVPYRLAELAWPGRLQPGPIFTQVAVVGTVALFLVNWMMRMVG
jgi:hypothetical protein